MNSIIFSLFSGIVLGVILTIAALFYGAWPWLKWRSHQAFEAGRRAYRMRAPLDQNPHDLGAYEHIHWVRGWQHEQALDQLG